MPEIIPAIIAKSKEELQQKLSLVESLVSWAQIDVMDGVFVPPTTWRDPADLAHIRANMRLEVHLMVVSPEHIIDAWLASPVKRILLHYESTTLEKLKGLIEKITVSGKEAGIVLKLDTPLSVLDEFLKAKSYKLKVVQLMGIAEIGYYGHGFEPYALDRIKSLRAKYPDVTIEIDGGVNLENAPLIVQAGADNLIAGSAIFKSEDIKTTIEKFKSAWDTYTTKK